MKLKCSECGETHYTDEANDDGIKIIGLKNYDCYFCHAIGTCKKVK